MNATPHGRAVEDRHRVLTFRLAHEPYAIDVRAVQELVGLTRLRRASEPTLCGHLALRGLEVPVVDLRLRAGLGAAERGAEAVVIVARLGTEPHDLVVGLLVDEVFDVVDLDGAASATAVSHAGRCRFVRGVTQLGERMIFLVRTDRILTLDEAHGLVAHGATP